MLLAEKTMCLKKSCFKGTVVLKIFVGLLMKKSCFVIVVQIYWNEKEKIENFEKD